jgi:hypothetical protein
MLRKNSIVYLYDNQIEYIYGKKDRKKLEPPPGARSYFTVETFKELEDALEYYKIRQARVSSCQILTQVWHDENKIFFKPRPEEIMRNSLTQFLKIRLRGNFEVRPEQNVDTTHPVDIKITWSMKNHIALIEIKWLGKSLNKDTGAVTNFTQSRALDGAKQLANYLDSNLRQAPSHSTIGYLVIYDGRRRNINKNTTCINRKDGFYYENKGINLASGNHKKRRDFAKPVRFFLEPLCTP